MIRLIGVPSSLNPARTVDPETLRMVSENHPRAIHSPHTEVREKMGAEEGIGTCSLEY